MTERTLSIGNLPSTLGSYLELTRLTFPHDSPAVAFLEKKIAESPNGADEEVIVDESQMLYVLATIDSQRKEGK